MRLVGFELSSKLVLTRGVYKKRVYKMHLIVIKPRKCLYCKKKKL
jgi:hypothetical protein